jgi:hypothetical protein
MDSGRLLWAVATWSCVLIGLYWLRRRSPFHLPTLALFVTGLIGTFFPVSTAFIAPSSWRNLDFLSPDIVVATQVQYAAFAAGLLLSVIGTAQLGWIQRGEERTLERNVRRDMYVASLLVVVGFALYAMYVQRVGASALFNREDYAHKYLLSQGLGPLQLGLPTAIIGCLWAEASDAPRSFKNLFLPIAATIVAWTILFISVRTNALIVLLGYASIIAWRRRFELRNVRVSWVVGMLGLYLALEFFALFRGVYRGDLSQALWMMQGESQRVLASAIGGSELSHPFVTAGEILRARESGELAGRSLIDGISACMPLGLFPDRPQMLSEQFVRSNYADLAARGGGAAFSLVAEAWLNFGSFLGPLIFGCAMGTVLAWAESKRERDRDGIVAHIVPFFVFYVAMQHRNEFGTLFKTVFMVSLVVLPIWMLSDALALSERRATSRSRRA